MALDLALVGTSGTMPLPGRWLASALIRWDGHLILFDCGEGTQISLRALGWGMGAIDLVLISHLHGDHVGGLAGLLQSLGHGGRATPVDVVGPPGLAETVRQLCVVAQHLPFDVRCHELPGSASFAFGQLRCSAQPAQHSVPCLAYRFDLPRQPRFQPERARGLNVPVQQWSALQRGETVTVAERTVTPQQVLGPPRPGLAVGLVTDTRPTPALATFLRGVDLLLCEGMYGDSAQQPRAEQRGHMTFAEAAGLARDAGARQLVLSHFSPSLADPDAYLAQATAAFPATVVGHDYLQISLTFPPDPPDGAAP